MTLSRLRPWMTAIIKMTGILVLICSLHLTAAGILKDNIVEYDLITCLAVEGALLSEIITSKMTSKRTVEFLV